MPDEFLTVAEIAEALKLNQQTVRNMIDRGELGAVRVGKRRIRVRRSQLDALLAAGEMPPGQEPEAIAGNDTRSWDLVRTALDAVVVAVDARYQGLSARRLPS